MWCDICDNPKSVCTCPTYKTHSQFNVMKLIALFAAFMLFLSSCTSNIEVKKHEHQTIINMKESPVLNSYGDTLYDACIYLTEDSIFVDRIGTFNLGDTIIFHGTN